MAMKAFIVVTVLTVLGLAYSLDEEKNLLRELGNRFDPAPRPINDFNKPVNVSFDFKMVKILNIDTTRGTITFTAWTTLKWPTDSLTWRPQTYGGLDSVRVDRKHIWLPDIVLFNSAEKTINLLDDIKVVVNSDGSVVYVPAKRFTAYCDGLRNPDSPSCTLKFGSWTYSSKQINLVSMTDGVDMSNFDKDLCWDITDTKAVVNNIKYDCCPETYQDISFTMDLKAGPEAPCTAASLSMVSVVALVMATATAFIL